MIKLLLVALLSLGLVMGTDTMSRNRNKGKGNRDREHGALKITHENMNRTDENPFRGMNKSENTLPLPGQMELVQDENVEMGPVHRRFSGENNSRLSCRGTVQGLTPEGGRPYFRYIKVNTSSCLQRNIIYPVQALFSYDIESVFDIWNITVTRLVFEGDDKRIPFRIPKRISEPTNVMMEAGIYDTDFRGQDKSSKELHTYFGFAVFFPNIDQQVKWTVEWQIDACRPFESDCESYHKDRNVTYDRHAFSISKEDGFKVWKTV